MARLLACASVAVLALTGCSVPSFSKLSFVTTRVDAVQVELLERNVRGQSCFSVDVVRGILRPPWRARPADHGAAIADALSKVEGADMLMDVSVYARVEQYLLFQRICSLVIGNAGRLR